MPQPEIVDSGVGSPREVPFDKGATLRSPYLRAVDGEIEPGSDGQHVSLPPVIDVAAQAVAHNGLGVEEHHVLAPADHAAAVGIVMRVDKTMPLEGKAFLSPECAEHSE